MPEAVTEAVVESPVATPDNEVVAEIPASNDDGEGFDLGTLESNQVEAPETPAVPETPVVPEVPAVPAAAAPVQPTTPAAPAAAPVTPAVPATPAAPAAAPVQPAAPAAPVASAEAPAAAPVVAPQTVEEATAARAKWRNETVDMLATKHYNLSQEQIDAIQVEPETVIPKMMARVYLDATEAATMAVMEHLPRVITSVMADQQLASQNEQDFYKAWPALNRETHHATVMQLATAYRQLNPTASKEDFVKFVGSQAIVTLGLHTQPAVAPASTPAVPSAQPHRPLAVSAPATRPLTPDNVSPFAQFAEEDLLFDRGE